MKKKPYGGINDIPQYLLEQYGDRGNTDPRVHQEQRESVAAAERETQQQNRGNNQDYNTQRHRKYLLLSVFKWRD